MAKRSPPATIDFLSPLELIPGMGPKRIAAFLESEVQTIGDLLYRFPLRYLDRSIVIPLESANEYIDKNCTATGEIVTVRFERGRRPRLRAQLRDDTGSIELLWFQGTTYYRQSIKKGQRIVATGKISTFNTVQMVHPIIETISDRNESALLPILPLYGLTGAMRDAGIGQRFMLKSIQWILKNCKHYPQILPVPIASRHFFPPLATCLKELHFPTDKNNLDSYKERIRFEELYQLALSLHFSRRKFLLPGRSLHEGSLLQQFKKQLPFEFTDDQSEAITTLLSDGASQKRMHRLLQGDVGSGKTVVAFCAALPALNGGLQVVWMTPTEVLARQTWQSVNAWLLPFGFQAELLTAAIGSRNAALRQKCSSGEARFIVGTHALLQPKVRFRNVGIFIVDEQHRFGAQQRLSLHDKDRAADFLLISATPIPQTLAQTLYGDLDIVTIRSLPPGRQPIATYLVPDSKRTDMERFITSQIASGRQCYYIVPRIEKVVIENENTPALRDLETTFTALTRGTFHNIAAGFIHGKLDPATKERTLDAFVNGAIKLLVATSVIEVGIDVARATVIVIENSERFGLAQLHQLRGRVGRGNEKSYCFLLTNSVLETAALQRLHSFCKENSGFKVAELDLQNRGPGEVIGYQQSGWENMIMADILRDAKLFSEIRSEIDQFLSGYFEK